MKCIILAGGSGERLWPMSRTLSPSSLLKLYDEKTLLQNTFELALDIAPAKNIVTVTNIRQETDTKIQLKALSKNPCVIAEPMAKNTAPAIAAALTFLQTNKDDTVVILPCDFAVANKELFIAAINKAKLCAKDGYITALGVKPSYPEVGFGYIKVGDQIKNGNKIVSFVEKPSLEVATSFVKDKSYFWNCGIIVSKISVLLRAFEKYSPSACYGFSKDMFDENNKIKYETYENVQKISIDYALMEKAQNTAVVELKTEWNDIGSWLAVYNHTQKDVKGNVTHGNVILDKVKNSLVYSSKELVAVSGMNDLVVVETEDAVLVSDKSKTAEIGKIVSELKAQKSEIVENHKTVFRPWGFYTCLNGGVGWLSKIITVSPGHKLSLQSHNHRSEHWVVLEGTATVILEGETHTLEKRQSIDIPLKAKHSLQNHTKEILKILEVQKGDYIAEDDIIRYEDVYGRVN